MRFAATCSFLLAATFAAGCSEQHELPVAPLPADAPALVIDRYESVATSATSETATWQVSGSGTGELVLRLVRFEDGEETVVGDQRLTVPQEALEGTLTIKSDAKTVACNLSLANADPIHCDLPAVPKRTFRHADSVTFKSLPNHINQAELWSRVHADHLPSFASVSPWHAQRSSLLRTCVDGVAAIVVTIEMVAMKDK